MRPQPDLPRRPSRRSRRAGRERRRLLAGRGRAVVGISLVLLFFLLISLRGIAAFYTDFLWFDSLSLASVWRTLLGTKAVLAAIGAVVFFALCWSNLLIAERLAPMFRPNPGGDDLIERYHELVGRRAWIVRAAVAGFLAVVVGVSLGSSWNEWILFTNRVDFGQRDAVFHTDIGFYVFQLPFLVTAAGWLFSSLVLVLIVTVLAHIVNGGIRFQTQLDRVTPQVKAHISVLLGVLALVQVGRYWLDRYQLTFSTRGRVDGATYTDVNVELRAIYLLMLIALFAFGLFIANIWRRGWVLPGMAVGLWILVAVLAGGVVPAIVQRFRVEPNLLTKESKYVANNIAATRDAYGLGKVARSGYDWTSPLDTQNLQRAQPTLANVRLWDPMIMRDSYERQQQIKSFYEISDVDVDRYVIDGKVTQVMIAARDLSDSGVPKSSWEASHLAYTHGYGVVAATANDKTSSGDPDLVAEDIPVKTSGGLPKIDKDRSGIYFGENKSGYVIVDTKRPEIDFQGDANETKFTSYAGQDGVRIGSGVRGFVRRTAFALRFGDINPLVSGNIEAGSRVLLERDVTARLQSVAPFLAYDHDPYMVIVDGKLKYVLDAYTTTRNYPNAQRADTGGLDDASGLKRRSFNYARNSVKAVVDAYEGTVDLYVMDQKEPILRAYRKAFPKLFTPVSKAPQELRDHFRYPEDLFTVQTQMWAKYHVGSPNDFINGNDEWAVPRRSGAATTSRGTTTKDVGPDGQPLTPADRYQSQYLLMQLPGEEEPSFVLLRPYVSSSVDQGQETGQNQLRAFIVADSDPGQYGRIKSYVLPVTNPPDGPNLAADAMQSDEAVGEQIRQRCTDKTTCTFAAPSIVPVESSLLYVQSFFVAGTGVGSPKLEQVIVSYERPGDPRVAIDTNLRGALAKIFGEDIPPGVEDTGNTDAATSDGVPKEPNSPQTVAERETDLIDKLARSFADADIAARDGDQVTYAEKIKDAAGYVKELQDLRNRPGSPSPASGSGGTTTTTSGEPTSSTTTTAPEQTTTTSAGA